MIKTRLVSLLAHAKKYIIRQVLWQWGALLSQILMIWLIAGLLEQAVYHELRPERAAVSMGAAVLFLGLRFLCDRRASHASFRAGADVKRILRERIYGKLIRLGASYREQVNTSEVVQMAAEGVEQLEIYFGKYLAQFFYSLLAPVTLFAVLVFVDWKASLVLLVCVPLIPASIVAVQKIAKRLLHKYWGIYTELGDSFLENLQGLTTLKIYGADGRKAEEMDAEAEKFRKITMKVLTMQLNSTSVMDVIAYGGAAAGMIVTVFEYVNGNVGIGGALMLILLAAEFFIPLRLLGSFFHIAMNGMAASDRIFALLDLEEPQDGTETLTGENPDILMTDVHFSYEPGREILRGMNLEIPKGSFTSVVGTSGCGKSTIAALITGRNRNYTGSMTIEGKEISDIREQSLAQQITLVRHNSYLFKGTVADNLRMGRPDATAEEMEDVLRQVNLWNFLRTRSGLDTEVAEKGSNFSGGQCQRLAIARALLHDSPVYIFDEATSNIDVESEEMIMDVIRSLAGRKTVILISHRLANVEQSDRIYMISGGVVEEQGTHLELMGRGGAYAELYLAQRELEQYGKEVPA